MPYDVLPPYKTWRSEIFSEEEDAILVYPVRRILLPGTYPTTTFVTDEFRYNAKPPEQFHKAFKAYYDENKRNALLNWVLLYVAIDISNRYPTILAAKIDASDLPTVAADVRDFYAVPLCHSKYFELRPFSTIDPCDVNSLYQGAVYDASFEEVFPEFTSHKRGKKRPRSAQNG